MSTNENNTSNSPLIRKTNRRQPENRNTGYSARENVCLLIKIMVFCAPIALMMTFIIEYFGFLDEFKNGHLRTTAECGKRIMGWHTSWNNVIDEKKLTKLTHLIFCFLWLNSYGQVSFESNNDRLAFFEMKNKARKYNPDARIMVSVGGAGKTKHFSSVFGDEKKRRDFIESIASFLIIHQVDGVDIFWTGATFKAEPSENILLFAKGMRKRLTELAKSERRRQPYLLSIAHPGTSHHSTVLKEVLNYADFINILTYDYYGPFWFKETGPTAPLYSSGIKGNETRNVDWSMHFFTCATGKPSQLNMGLQFIGRYWINVKGALKESDEMWRVAEPVNGTIVGGTFTWKNLQLQNIGKSESVWHNESKSTYIWNPEQEVFLSYEKERSLMEKMKYARAKNFGGVIMWSAGADDDDIDSLMNIVSSTSLCSNYEKNAVNYEC